MKPIESSIVTPIDNFFEVDSTQCLCYKMPSKRDGWVIQGLGQVQQQEPMYSLIGSEPPVAISEPSLGLSFFCVVGMLALVAREL